VFFAHIPYHALHASTPCPTHLYLSLRPRAGLPVHELLTQDFKVHELSDPQIWDMNVKDVLAREEFHFTQRMLQ
jgi:hypothetical protein